MESTELVALAEKLRSRGFEARNLGQVGITIWHDGVGHFFPSAETNELAQLAFGPGCLDELLNRSTESAKNGRTAVRAAHEQYTPPERRA